MTVKTASESTRKFVSKHRVAIAITATSVSWFALLRYNNRQLNDFLKEHDLFDEYYTPEDSY